MKFILAFSGTVLFSILLGCVVSKGDGKIAGYDLSTPVQEFKLPKDLVEISGLAYWKKDHVAMVQDEDDIVFIYDLSKEEVIDEVKFHKDGDHEGVASDGEHLYVLRSDGDIFRLKDLKGEKTDSKHWENALKHENDAEGLCYDKRKKRLLIACKGAPGERMNGKKVRTVWSVSAKDGTMKKKPLFVISKDSVNAKLQQRYGALKREFAPSAIEIHPRTGNFWMLSARGNVLAIFDREGNCLDAMLLSELSFKQPEAITFTPNGDLIIANEGRNKRAVMYRFKQMSK